MAVRTLDELIRQGVAGQRVFVRADLNVPTKDGQVGDDTRIRATLPTLRKLVGAGARVVVASHLGRPKGKVDSKYTLAPVAARLGELLGAPVAFASDCIGPDAEAAAAKLGDGQVLLLENLRFHPEEEKNEPGFAAALAKLADVYVNDAFGTAHRAHASTAGIVAHVRRSAAGDLLRAELEHLRRVLEPERPFLCLLGGAKVSDKLAVLEAMVRRADAVCVGGAMAYTFLRAQGKPVGTSLVEAERADDARRVLAVAQETGHALLLPVDHVVAQKIETGAEHRTVREIPDGWMGVDIGPETARLYAERAARAKTIFWNGPMGVFEIEAFAKGTEALARAVADSPAASVVGGGDSLAAVNRVGVADRITHCSTGGGASLEFVEGRALPGVTALENAP
ncbi:MAG: phosphoglycerate kinase [Proteobacteria bacterium]|nr:MAG: phosphoglycerate kinase [Pseudomonadota bacterium]